MADDNPGRRGEGGSREDLGQDPFVEQARPDPSQPAEPVRRLEGLLGNSDRPGYRRLYFSRALDNYAEFRDEDVVSREAIPADQPPFLGTDATRIAVRRSAAIEYTRVDTGVAADEFDLDVRFEGPGDWELGAREFWPTGYTVCKPITCRATCDDFTCPRTCRTCRPTCRTCARTCAPTCAPTCPRTCAPTCPRTCAPTCPPTCVTCDTCDIRCQPPTEFGPRCSTHVFTCAGWQCL